MIVAVLFALSLSATADAVPSAKPGPTPSSERRTGAAFTKMTKKLFVPSFSRQTKLPCGVCHNGFPQLTAFGRLFKLNGYTMTGLATINGQGDSIRLNLELSPIAPLSVMAIISHTRTATSIPGTINGTSEFPQQLSFFAATQISPKMGAFTQFTYAAQDKALGIDNVDVRYASHVMVHDKDLLYGVTLHNNPTVQDVWNTLPAWSYPFNSAGTAPHPVASTLIDGGLAQTVLGVGTYALYNNLLYGEVSGYTSAPQGAAAPADSTSTNTPRGLSPYWRLALQRSFGDTYVMVGSFGLDAHVYPGGFSGLTNHYSDLGFDAQVERRTSKGMLIGRASYVKENQSLTAFHTATPAESNLSNSLNAYKANLTYLPSLAHIFTVGLFGTTGSSDALLYPSESVTGSANGSPTSRGATLEYSYNPWLNTRFGAQYTLYSRFNGASSSYDEVSGRNARANNTLYLFLWLAY